ncbi:DUF1924 domain-containing protein [Thiolapillus sp.]
MNAGYLVLAGALLAGPAVSSDAIQQMFDEYRQQGVTTMNAQAGKALWEREFPNKGGGQLRSCTDCHGSRPENPGKHVRTGKPIEPMAVSANGKRFSDPGKIRKWFKRNCKWTLGRECSAQEQADILVFLSSQ